MPHARFWGRHHSGRPTTSPLRPTYLHMRHSPKYRTTKSLNTYEYRVISLLLDETMFVTYHCCYHLVLFRFLILCFGLSTSEIHIMRLCGHMWEQKHAKMLCGSIFECCSRFSVCCAEIAYLSYAERKSVILGNSSKPHGRSLQNLVSFTNKPQKGSRHPRECLPGIRLNSKNA